MLSRFVHYVIKMGIAVAVFFLCGLIFFFFNLKGFNDIGVGEFIKVNIASVRFSLSAIAVLFSAYTVFIFFPIKRSENIDRKVGNLLYLLPLIISVMLNAVDWEYYKYIGKRTGSELFLTNGLSNDIVRLMPRFIVDFWYVCILIFIFIWIIILANKKINLRYPLSYISENIFIKISLLILVLLANIIAFRGGLQMRPIKPIAAGLYTQPKYIPLILNTPFCIIRSTEGNVLEEKNYFSNRTELIKYFNPIKEITNNNTLNKPNVVIIILESFSKEYMGYGGVYKGYTPFLDSLLKQSWFFPNAFANGKRSIEGVPAIVGGIPSLSETPYISSTYSSNQIDALPVKLKEMGYYSAFFHGGHNGTMGFDYFAKLAGIDKYYGYNEYKPLPGEEDGNWGIYDEPYLKYTAKKLSEFKTPFLATVFTLSSHHPFTLPKNFKYNSTRNPAHPILKTINYTDWALQQFFTYAKKQSWFNNTLFVITADHTGPDLTPAYGSLTGIYKIPIAYYMPGILKYSIDDRVTQQIDITPTVLSLCGYKGKIYCFGENMNDTSNKGYAINYVLNTHQYITDSLVFHYYNEEPLRLLNYKKDTMLRSNLLLDYPQRTKELELKTKAFIQTYHHDLIHNQTRVK